MDKLKIYIPIILLIITGSCNNSKTGSFSFYHWKSNAEYTKRINDALKQTRSTTIYMHYFDVDKLKERTTEDDGLYPEYVVTKIDSAYKNFNIVPVIFITNNTFKQDINLLSLSDRISDLVNSISIYHFNKIPARIQLDCDWTESTAKHFFYLIEQLKNSYEVSVTIRLHQIKFKKKTGIPPVDKGVLMLYNIGDLTNMYNNSILDPSIVEQYIDRQTKYPIELDVALPLFSQTVVKNNDNEYKLINKTDIKKLRQNSDYFLQTDQNLYKVLKDTLYEGLYLSEDYQIKIERPSEDDIISSYNIVKASKLHISNIIFYHLDDLVLKHMNPKNLTTKL